MLTQERLKELLHYDPETGIFTWLIRTSYRVAVGAAAGSRAVHRGGREVIQISLDKKLYLAHRLAWLYVYGHWPSADIDHIDRCSTNNAVSNLRCATRKQNMENTGLQSNNTSGFKGVSWGKELCKWVAHIQHNRKQIHLGSFDTPEEASLACEAARDKLFTHHKQASSVNNHKRRTRCLKT